MALSTFHPFPNLPYELRLRIWELAIRPSGYTGGLHHFFITSNKDANESNLESLTLLEYFNSSISRYHMSAVPKIGGMQGDSSNIPGKRSVYFWDAGLWTACKESRDIINKESKKDYQHEMSYVSERHPYFNEHLYVNEHLPALVTVPQHDQDWCLMVQPYKDVFCFTPKDWGLDIDWENIWCDLAFTTLARGFGPVRHLAVEFGPSWNLDWPGGFYLFDREPSARGFVARLIQDILWGEMDCFVWLIDRSTPTPQASTRTTPPRVFYDLDMEYVETERREISWDANGEEIMNSAFFINKLERLGQWSYVRWGTLDLIPVGSSFDIDEYLGILTCSDLKK